MMKSKDNAVDRTESDFRIYTKVDFFEKADAPEGERRRVAGVISTESLDKDQEVVIQKGLDFSTFLKDGWLNDNHSQKQTDNVGYPLGVQFYSKGQSLPNGDVAKTDSHWMEAVLLEDYPLADQIWKLGRALSKTKARKLGYSIEGKILRRTGPTGKVIASAAVKNVAVTHCPANPDTYMVTLAKSLMNAECEYKAEDDEAEKALTVGDGSRHDTGPKTGAGAGALLSRESLDDSMAVTCHPDDDIQKAYRLITKKYPHLSGNAFHRLISLTGALKRAGVM